MGAKFSYFNLLLLLPLISFGQLMIGSPLTEEKTSDSTFPINISTMRLLDTAVNINVISLKSYGIFQLIVNETEEFFEDYYMRKKIPDSIFKSIIEKKGLPRDLFNTFENKNTILILIGYAEDNSLIIIPDCNSDANFNNDFIFNYGPIDTSKENVIKLDNISFYNISYRLSSTSSPQIKRMTRDLVINPQANIKKSVVQLYCRNYLQGNIHIGNNNFNFLIDLISWGLDFKFPLAVRINLGNQLHIKYYEESDKEFYKLKDTIKMGKYTLLFDSVSTFGEIAFFKLIDSSECSEVPLLNDLQLMNIATDKIERITNNSSKFFLLDFWATWCAPCIRQHQIIKEMVNNSQVKNLSVVGILYDFPSNLNNAKTYSEKENIPWRNYFMNQKDMSKQAKYLNILALPTYMLIDSTGNIYIKTASLSKVVNLLNKLNGNQLY